MGQPRAYLRATDQLHGGNFPRVGYFGLNEDMRILANEVDE